MSAFVSIPTGLVFGTNPGVVVKGVVLACRKHPTYRAVRRPTWKCSACLVVYNAVHHPEKVK